MRLAQSKMLCVIDADLPVHPLRWRAGNFYYRNRFKPLLSYSAMKRIGFMHLRNVKILEDTSFEESGHLTQNGSLDMNAIVKALVETGFDGYFRPDHGRMIWGETGKPGYGLFDRALGTAYLNGLIEANGGVIET